MSGEKNTTTITERKLQRRNRVDFLILRNVNIPIGMLFKKNGQLFRLLRFDLDRARAVHAHILYYNNNNIIVIAVAIISIATYSGFFFTNFTKRSYSDVYLLYRYYIGTPPTPFY